MDPAEEKKDNPVDPAADTPVVTEPPVAPQPPVKADDEKVEIPKKTLDLLLEKIGKLEKDVEVALEAGDKGKIARIIELRAQGKLIKSVNVSVIDGKIIVGWVRVKDDVYFDENGRMHESQIINVYFNDKTNKELDYRMFSRMKSLLPADVIRESKDSDGNYNLHIMLADGQELDIDPKFVN